MIDLDPIADLADARNEWSDLAAGSGNIFATWEWAEAWWRHFGSDEELLLFRSRHPDQVPAIFPLYASRRGPVRLLRFVGHGVGDVLGPICARADAREATAALRSALADGSMGRWDVLLAERLPGESGAGGALGGKLMQSEASPTLSIAGQTWDEWLSSTSKNMREKLRRNTRKLENGHELTYTLCEDPAGLDDAMDTLFRLHAMRWSEDGGAFQRHDAVPFHREFAAVALERGWLRLWTMHLDGGPIAAWYGFRFGDCEAYYQSGRDPGYDRFSVGFLMLMHSIKAAFDDGLESYAFLRGDESYKGRFATTDGELETRVLARGPVGRTGVGIGSLALGVPSLRRRIIAGVG